MADHRGRRLLATVALVPLLACGSDDDGPSAATTTTASRASTTSTESVATTIAPADPVLDALLLRPEDLPEGFARSPGGDDTVTSFCAGQDATSGLRASGRALRAFTRTPAGASVIQVLFRFEGTGAADFVNQADTLLDGCSEVPDITGLAFTYTALAPELETALAGAQAHTGRYGTSVGSGSLTIDVAVLQQGDLGLLVAVLGLDQPRAELDALALDAFEAALARLGGG